MIEWRDIPGWEELYQVSSNGAVRSYDRTQTMNGPWGQMTRTRKGRILKSHICSGHKYYSVEIYGHGGSKRYFVHRLVALAFCENPLNKPDVNHKNGNKMDNTAGNLEWVSKSENMMHALDTGLSGGRGGTHYAAIKIIDTRTGNTYDTIKEAAKAIGVSNGYLKNMLAGRQHNKTTLKRLHDERV